MSAAEDLPVPPPTRRASATLGPPPLRLHAPERWEHYALLWVAPQPTAAWEALVLDTRRLEGAETRLVRQGDMPARWVGWWLSLCERLLEPPFSSGACGLVVLKKERRGLFPSRRALVGELSVREIAHRMTQGEFALCWGLRPGSKDGPPRFPLICEGAALTLPGRGGALIAADATARAALAEWFP